MCDEGHRKGVRETTAGVNKRPYVALFIGSLRGGGAERVMLLLAKAFAARGLRVDLVLTRAEGAYMSDVPRGVQVVDLRVPAIRFVWVVVLLTRLLRYLRRERPPVMLSFLNQTNVEALLVRRVARVPTRLVVSERATMSAGMKAGPNSRMRWLVWRLMRWTYPWAEAIVAPSKGVAEDLLRVVPLDRDKVKVIYNPVARPDLSSRAEEPVDHPWFAVGMPPVILGAGGLRPQKDFSTLIRAFAQLRKAMTAHLVILGDGDERPRLEELVRELALEKDVLMPGFTDNPYKHMKRAGVFVLSSRWEGLPNVLIEAMACGCPVVSTDCPSGPAEILENGKWGKLVPMGDAEALAAAIAEALHEPRGRPEERAAHFSVERAVESYLEVLLGTPAGSPCLRRTR